MKAIAIVAITQGNGTFNATARVGSDITMRASCTMGREFAATRAAAKALGCDEKRVKLTQAVYQEPGVFNLSVRPHLSEQLMCAVNTDSVFVAEWLPETFTEPLTWHTEGHPDADTTVLIQDADDEVGEGWWDGESWRWVSSALIPKIKAWADMPGGVP